MDLNTVYNFIYTYHKETILALLILWLIIRLYDKRKRRLKRKKYRNKKLANTNTYYNTGFRFELNFKDFVKIKIRMADYCDKKAIRYNYLFDIKFGNFEFLKTKITDQKGHVIKRNVTFRS